MVYFGKTVNLSSTTETWTPKYVGEELEVHEITGQGRLKIVCGNAISEHFITGRISSIRMTFVESVIFSLIDGNEVSLHGVIEDNRAAESDHQEDNRGQSEHQSINDNTKLCKIIRKISDRMRSCRIS
ncbi:hypothetical protein HA402_008424 [Bradysia odoriphaga]|nr:hypothetical protein HA402_008424 [Bradysia odoriphaga]